MLIIVPWDGLFGQLNPRITLKIDKSVPCSFYKVAITILMKHCWDSLHYLCKI